MPLKLIHVIYRKRILVVLTHHNLRLGHTRSQLLLQLGPEHLPEVPALRIAVKHGDERLALLNRPQRRVVARLPRHEEVHVGLLQDIVPAAGADAKAAHLGPADVRTDGARDHDVAQAAQSRREALDNLLDGHGVAALFKVADGAVPGWGVRLGGRGAGDRHGALGLVRAGDDIREPGVQPLGGGIDGRVRAVDGDACLGQVQEGGLLRVGVGDGFEAGEDERV